MSVTLFHCLRCGIYTNSGASVGLWVSATLDCVKGVLWGHDVLLPRDGFSLDDIVESYCPECSPEYNEPMELVVLDECPHRWESFYGYPCGRRCVFCNEQQEGHVVYDV